MSAEAKRRSMEERLESLEKQAMQHMAEKTELRSSAKLVTERFRSMQEDRERQRESLAQAQQEMAVLKATNGATVEMNQRALEQLTEERDTLRRHASAAEARCDELHSQRETLSKANAEVQLLLDGARVAQSRAEARASQLEQASRQEEEDERRAVVRARELEGKSEEQGRLLADARAEVADAHR